MDHHDELFQPEHVNEQIEELMNIQDPRQQQATPGALTIAALRSIYTEDAAILERAWSRIAQAEHAAQHQVSAPGTLPMAEIRAQGEQTMSDIYTPTRVNKAPSHFVANNSKRDQSRKPLRLWAFIGLVAALLFVLANVIVFRNFGEGHHNPASQNHPSEIGKTLYTHTFPHKGKGSDDDINIGTLQWSPDGKHLAVAAGPIRHGSVHIWDALTGNHEIVLTPGPATNQFADPEVYATQVAWSPDGKRLASAIGDVQVWDPATGKLLARYFPSLHITAALNQIAWSPDGRYLAAGYNTYESKGGVTIWDTKTGREVKTLSGDQIDEISWSPNGKYFTIASNGSGKLVFWDTTNWQPVLTLHSGALAWSPDSIHIALAAPSIKPSGKIIQIVSIPAGKVTHTLSADGAAYTRGLSWSPDGKRIVFAGSKAIQIWDSQTGKKLYTYPQQESAKDGSSWLGSLCWSPDGKYIASSLSFGPRTGGGGNIKVWHAE